MELSSLETMKILRSANAALDPPVSPLGKSLGNLEDQHNIERNGDEEYDR